MMVIGRLVARMREVLVCLVRLMLRSLRPGAHAGPAVEHGRRSEPLQGQRQHQQPYKPNAKPDHGRILVTS